MRADHDSPPPATQSPPRSPVGVLDDVGGVVALNSCWREAPEGFLGRGCEVGTNYLDFCSADATVPAEVAQRILANVRQVLRNESNEAWVPYSYGPAEARRWLQLHVMRLEECQPEAIVVTHYRFDHSTHELHPLSGQLAAEQIRMRDLLRDATELIDNASHSLLGNLDDIAQSLCWLREGRFASTDERDRLFDQALTSSQDAVPAVRELLDVAAALSDHAIEATFASQAVFELLRCLAEQSNQRSGGAEKRYAVALPVLVTPLDQSQQPAGPPFHAVTRDISASSISLIHTSAVTADFLSLQITDPAGLELTTTVEVLRYRPIGPLMEIVGRFAAKVHSSRKPNSPAHALPYELQYD